jgi:hypothetical protein
VFSGEFGDLEWSGEVRLDADAAAEALRRAGYEVFRLPDRHGGVLAHPLDDFLEVHAAGPDDAKLTQTVMREIDAIVWPYGGLCNECGPIRAGRVPFADLLGVDHE